MCQLLDQVQDLSKKRYIYEDWEPPTDKLENFFDLWMPIPSEFIGLAYKKNCELM